MSTGGRPPPGRRTRLPAPGQDLRTPQRRAGRSPSQAHHRRPAPPQQGGVVMAACDVVYSTPPSPATPASPCRPAPRAGRGRLAALYRSRAGPDRPGTGAALGLHPAPPPAHRPARCRPGRPGPLATIRPRHRPSTLPGGDVMSRAQRILAVIVGLITGVLLIESYGAMVDAARAGVRSIIELWPLGTEALALAMEVSVLEAKRLRHRGVRRRAG